MEEFTIVGLKELRENMEVYITKVQQGGSFVVVRKSKVVFRIAPPNDGREKEETRDKRQETRGAEQGRKLPAAKMVDDAWEEVVDFTKIKRGGVSIPDLLSRL
jgi:antitoxin (DNA-binding transcriptional repressor) of toxin-antitoxin stability system